MNIRIEDKQCFEEMLKNGEIKTEWSQFERCICQPKTRSKGHLILGHASL